MRGIRTFLVVSVVASALSGGAARADLRCDESRVTLGEVKAGKPLSHRFTITNRDTEVASILSVQPSCGCLKPRLEERRLRPGDTAVLLLEVNTLTAPPGPNSWRVQIGYNQGGMPRELTLTLCATVVAEITIQPAALVLQTESSLAHEITLTDSRATPLIVTGVRTTAALLEASVRAVGPDKAGIGNFAVKLDVLPGFPEGRHEETLQIFSSDPEYPELRVPVTVIKQSRAAVCPTPSEVSLRDNGGPLPGRIVRLRGAQGKVVVVERVECEDPAVQCTWASGPGDMATLRVQVDRTKVSATAGLNTTLVVRLASPAGQEVLVPIHCMPK
jgi:hypothetical protein